jgi:hypothetical protein
MSNTYDVQPSLDLGCTPNGGGASPTMRSALTPQPEGGEERSVLAAAVLASLITRVQMPLPPLLVPSTGRLVKDGLGARHTEGHEDERSLNTLWQREGETPVFEAPSALVDLQVWHDGSLHRFTGEAAARRLGVLAPTICSERAGSRRGAVAQAYVGEKLGFRITGSSLARSYAGAAGIAVRDWKQLSKSLLRPKWRPQTITGGQKNRRFFDSVISVFAHFHLLERYFKESKFSALGRSLVSSMLQQGRCRTALVEEYLTSLEVLLHGHEMATSKLHRALLSLPHKQRAALWKTRRLFAKDDNDPLANATEAMNRMVVPVSRTTEEEALALKVLENFQRRAASFVAGNLRKLREHHDRAGLHRAAASLFFTRNLGGGAAEMHLTVALYRLANGRASPLQDVWGHTPEALSLDGLYDIMESHTAVRKEIEAACDWMIQELERRKISYPYLCIYPAREVKSRNFMLLPYCLQQGGYQAATTVAQYLRTRESTTEVFRGFRDSAWLRGLRKDIEEGATHLLSLDSQVATDPLPHDLCRKVFAPFWPVFSPYTRRAVEAVFSPTRVHVARGRPEDFLRTLSFTESLLRGMGGRVSRVNAKRLQDVGTSAVKLRVHANQVPKHLRTYEQRRALVEGLKLHGRLILKAPTGSGKTVLVSTLLNAIVQFPSVAALELMSQYLQSIGVPHNVHHARQKTQPMEMDQVSGEPRTILCTAFFVERLHRQFPGMVVMLDEAETKQENYLRNIEYTRRVKCLTILASATPDELLGEDTTFRLELQGGTNFPINFVECTYAEMLETLSEETAPKALVCAHSEPLCEKLATTFKNAGRRAFALTARMRSLGEYKEKLDQADVILSTNAIRSSVTLPDLVVVFDLTRMYESIDFPLSGMEALVLMEVSEAMRQQCAGRVGRVQPGTYVRVTDPPGEAIPYSPEFLARVPVIAAQAERISPNRYSRVLNHGSIVVERFSQQLLRDAGVKSEPFCPWWASAVRQLAPHATKKLLAAVAFEALGIVNRTRQVAEDVDLRQPYDVFQKNAPTDYGPASRALLQQLERYNWFPAETAQISRWCTDLPDDESEELFTSENQRAVCLALWRQVATVQGPLLVGRYRNFSCKIPIGMPRGSDAYLVLGLSLHHGEVASRWAIPLLSTTVAYVDELWAGMGEVRVAEEYLTGTMPAVLGWDVALKNRGKQQRRVLLQYDKYTRAHVFQPEDKERVWSSMLRVLAAQKVGEDKVTCQGSPMSATASFTVLNSFGLAAHDYVRDTEGSGPGLHGAGVFGDDDVRAGSATALSLGTAARESLGLQTKASATGMARVAEGGKLIGCEDQLGVFTERMLDLRDLSIIPSQKPAGLLRLYQAQNPSQLPLSTVSYLSDMLHYKKQLERHDPGWVSVLSGDEGQIAVPRRQTAPRRILARLLKSRVTEADRLATGEVSRLFDHLEMLLLQVCPSTKGAPDRVDEELQDPLGHPVISLRDARMFERYLQSEDCFFKLHGPPLQLMQGPWSYEAAIRYRRQTQGGPPPSVDEAVRFMQSLGWGVTPSKEPHEDEEEWTPGTPPPMDFGWDV